MQHRLSIQSKAWQANYRLSIADCKNPTVGGMTADRPKNNGVRFGSYTASEPGEKLGV